MLNEGALVQLPNVFPGVQLEATGLREWYDQAPSEAAAHQHSHNAEVEYHGGACVVVFNARHTGVSNFDSVRSGRHHLHRGPPLLLFFLVVLLIFFLLLVGWF